MTVRHATQADVPALLALARTARAAAPGYRDRPLDLQALERAADTSIQQGGAFLAEVEGRPVGAVLGYLFEHPVTGERVAAEYVTWLAPSARRGWAGVWLLQAWGRWGMAVGATRWELRVSSGVDPERIARLARAIGLRDAGVTRHFAFP